MSAVAEEDRRQRLADLVERFPLQDPAQFAEPVADLAAAGRFLLVEQSRYDARHFLSAHADTEEAAAYRDGQEYPGDWEVVTLVDLDTRRGVRGRAAHPLHRRRRAVMSAAAVPLGDRVAGGLIGLAAGDALGATVEFLAPDAIARRHGRHRDICGGGAFGWRPGQGTDDTDLAYAVARAYAEGYSLDRVARHFLTWYQSGPRDIGRTTAAALGQLARGADPALSGHLVEARAYSAGNGSLMRALATGLVRTDASQRRIEAVAISAVTHAERRCTQACAVYCDLVALMLAEATPAEAVEAVLASSPMGDDVAHAVASAGELAGEELDTSGYVLATLQVGVWALLQPRPLEDVLVEVVNLGGDADTTAAVAGGLLGVRDGIGAVPARWVEVLEYREPLLALVSGLLDVRGGRPSVAPTERN